MRPVLALLLLLSLHVHSQPPVTRYPAKGSNTLRLVTYNVRNCKGLDGIIDSKRIAGILLALDADIVALQEVDSCTQRYHGDFVLGTLASLTGMQPVYAPAISFQGGKYGIGLLSKQHPLSWRAYPLPGREEKRVVMVAEFDDFYILNTHLSLTVEDQLSSVDSLMTLSAGREKPAFLMGDLNATPGTEPISRLGNYFICLSDTAQPTFPANRPTTTIDYIMATEKHRGIRVINRFVVDEPVASDHRPVCIDFIFYPAKGDKKDEKKDQRD